MPAAFLSVLLALLEHLMLKLAESVLSESKSMHGNICYVVSICEHSFPYESGGADQSFQVSFTALTLSVG